MTTKEALRKIAQTTDEALLPLYAEEAALEAGIAEAQKIAEGRYGAANKAAAEKRIADLGAKLDALRAEMAPLAAIAKAGLWSRFVLVPGGHVHRPYCSTLRFTTARYIMPEYSGADEAELVEIAGEAACTVCFPSAPVDRPTRIPALVKEREEREAEAAARAAKKAAAKAAEIKVGRKVYKTQRAAENQIGWEIENVVSRRYMAAQDAAHREHLNNLAAEDLEAARTIAEAVAAAIEGYDAQAILEKKFAAKVKEYRKYPHYTIPADAAL
ncbi:hypothetical protein SEA_TWEETY19_47 [Arthrobacter phage Tweety19]|uniref:Uncharacterized protein n=1 Tax=Arthrobacter phage Tweety19 TaxID=2768133 RepID=A0A7G9W243_9CAUD|nr:hypothetical protein PQE19_gp62 [Arthrobacter phage Tweety19]QNO12706.1 hypothetical protein SEA_TWEETY19_47 [Arthrobacter phage Tweety19]